MKKYVAEGFGTLMLVFMGCGSAVLAGEFIGNLGIAFAFGLTVMVMVYAIGGISGCHINPAITVAMWVNKKIESKDALAYIGSQLAGAFLGAMLLYTIASGTDSYDILINGLGQNGYGVASPAGYGILSAMLAEYVLSALFLFVICAAVSKKFTPGFAGITIGLCLTLIHIVGIPVTGVSVNPARSFGPALINLMCGNCLPFSQLWLFVVMPILGAISGAWLWFRLSDEK